MEGLKDIWSVSARHMCESHQLPSPRSYLGRAQLSSVFLLEGSRKQPPQSEWWAPHLVLGNFKALLRELFCGYRTLC